MPLTTKDFDRIEKLIDRKLDEKIKFLPTREEFKELEAKIEFLPTKDEFYVSMDKIMKELSTIREELALTPSFTQVADLEEKVEALEKQIHTL